MLCNLADASAESRLVLCNGDVPKSPGRQQQHILDGRKGTSGYACLVLADNILSRTCWQGIAAYVCSAVQCVFCNSGITSQLLMPSAGNPHELSGADLNLLPGKTTSVSLLNNPYQHLSSQQCLVHILFGSLLVDLSGSRALCQPFSALYYLLL